MDIFIALKYGAISGDIDLGNIARTNNALGSQGQPRGTN